LTRRGGLFVFKEKQIKKNDKKYFKSVDAIYHGDLPADGFATSKRTASY